MRYIPKTHRELILLPVCLSLIPLAVSCEKDDQTSTEEVVDLCPDDPNKTKPGICGCGIPDVLNAITGLYTCMTDIVDFCPNDPNKTSPGICGCGIADTKGPDGIALCLTQNIDLCPDDPNKTLPGICGCGVDDFADDGSGIPPCLEEKFDLCPDNPDKTAPGVCGCDVPDTLDPATGIPLCLVNSIDFCPTDPNKKMPGVCGCGIPDVDSDDDGTLDCVDQCPMDSDKIEPGTCGCGVPDSPENLADNDRDGTPNCNDACPTNPYKKDDDGCSCDEINVKYGGKMICATMIGDADTFIKLRDAWNAGELDSASTKAFVLADNINLGDVIAEDSAKWIGWGTEEMPFNAIFIGNSHTISATVEDGTSHIQLTLGDARSDDIALFGFTDSACINDLTLSLSLVGKSNVAPLIAHAIKTTVSNVSVHARVMAETNAAGIVAQADNSTFSLIEAQGSVTVVDDGASCLVAQARNAQIGKARALCNVTGGTNAAGAVSVLSASSKIIDLYSNATVSGDANASGIVSKATSHSCILNSYTTSTVTCHEAPCALVAAAIDEFVTIKNVYTLGNISDQRQPSDGDPTSSHSENGEDLDDNDKNINDGEGSDPKNGNELFSDDLPTQPDPDVPPGNPEESVVAETPIAVLVASFGSTDSVIASTYYWDDRQIIPLPEIANMPGVAEPVSFTFTRLRPYTSDLQYLPDALNNALLCNGNSCTLDANECTPWIVGAFTLTTISGSILTVSIPKLRFQPAD